MRSLKKTFILMFVIALVVSCISPITTEAAAIKLSKTKATIYCGKSVTLNIANTGSKTVKWTTSNKKVATISKSSGKSTKVTGKAKGTATIIATVSGKSYSCKVTVKQEVINVTARLNVTGVKDNWRRYYAYLAPEDHLITLFKGDKGKLSFTTTSNPKITSDNLTNIKYNFFFGKEVKEYMKLSSNGAFNIINTPKKDYITFPAHIGATAEYKGSIVNIEFVDILEIAGERLVQSFDKVEQVSKQIITPDMNDAEKVLAVHDWICLNTSYSIDEFTGEEYDHQLPGAVLDGSTVCQGYTEAFSAFMQYLRIEERQIHSLTRSHIWNQVKLDGEWYFIDCTSDDTADLIGYGKFLQSGRNDENEALDCKYEPNGRYDNTDCLATGTYWRYKVFEKYKASSEAEAREVINSQADEPIVHVMFYDMQKSWLEIAEIGFNYAKEVTGETYPDYNIITINHDGKEYYLFSYMR